MFIFLTSVNVAPTKDFDRLDSLLTLISNGDKQALSELYSLTSSSVYGFALSILKDTYNAQDVLQSCFIKNLGQCKPLSKRHKANGLDFNHYKKSVLYEITAAKTHREL